MGRDYQRIQGNRWVLPRNLYRQTLYAIRDYPRIKDEYEALLHGSPADLDGQPKGNLPGDPTAATAVKAERLHNQIKAVDDARKVVPPEYMLGIWKNILYGCPYPLDAGRATYSRWKSRFIYEVAKNRFFM